MKKILGRVVIPPYPNLSEGFQFTHIVEKISQGSNDPRRQSSLFLIV